MTLRTLAQTGAKLLPLVVSCGLLVLIATQFDGFALLTTVDLPLLAAGTALAIFIDTTIGAWKWWRVIGLAGLDLSFGRVWRLWTGLLPATFLAPFQSGHLLYAVALQRAAGIGFVRSLETVAYDKYLSLVGTFFWIGVGQLILPADHALAHPLIAAGAFAVIAFYAVDLRLLGHLARVPFIGSRTALLRLGIGPRDKIELLAIAIVYQSSDLISLWIASHCLAIEPDPIVLFGAFPVVLLLTYAPISVSGFGVREGLIALFLGDLLGNDGAIACGLLVDWMEYVGPAIFGVVALPYLLRVLGGRLRVDPPAASEPAESATQASVAPPTDNV